MKNFGNQFASLFTPQVAMQALGTQKVVRVFFSDAEGRLLRTAIPNMPESAIEPYMITQRKIGRSSIYSWERAELEKI